MNKWLKLTGGLIVLLIIVIGLLTALWSQHSDDRYEDSLRSDYEYNIIITSSSELQNATFYLPAPFFENKSEGSGKSGESGESGKNPLFSEEDFYGRPSDWNFSFEKTEHGPMLKIEAEKIQPVFHSLPVAISETEEIEKEAVEGEMEEEREPMPGPESFKESHEYSEETPVSVPFDFGARVEVEPLINTRNPEGNESLLLPKYGLKVSEKGPIVPPPEHIKPRYYDYESRIYTNYETSPETVVEIYVSFLGSNAWWIYGWTGNEYNDRVSVKLTGPQEGWTPAEGRLITANGVYRD